MVLRIDQTRATASLLNEVYRARAGTITIAEKSSQGGSRENGLAERALPSVENLIRVLKLALETRLRTRLSVMHFVFRGCSNTALRSSTRFCLVQMGRQCGRACHGRRNHGEMLRDQSNVLCGLSKCRDLS